MKRAFTDSDDPDLSNLQTTISTAFNPEQEQDILDICKKGRIEGTGWIEGKVWSRGNSSNDTWEFVISHRLGYRVNVLLSGSISEKFSRLPIASGAKVRLGMRGVAIEDWSKVSKLYLGKTFAWRDGVVLHVRNDKTDEEVFFDTYAEHPSPVVDPTVSDTISKRRKRPPSPSPRVQPISDGTPVEVNGTTSPRMEDAMDIPQPAVVDPLEAQALKVPANDENSESTILPGLDPQNPQSLPSPPPELNKVSEECGAGIESTQPKNDTSRNDHQNYGSSGTLPFVNDAERTVEINADTAEPSHAKRNTKQPSNVAPKALASAQPTSVSLPVAELKKLRGNQQRRQKRRQMVAATHAAQKLKPDAHKESAAADSDEEYWSTAALHIPDHALPVSDNTGQEEDAGSDHIHIPSGSVESVLEKPQQPHEVQDSEACSHIPNAPEISCSNEPEHQSLSQGSEKELDPAQSLLVGCTSLADVYTTLAEFGRSRRSTYNIMGIAHSPGTISQTKRGEYMMRIFLFDPSNHTTTNGLSIALFERAEDTLPKPEAGDVVLLKNIVCDSFNGGNSALGASLKGWQWAVFHVKTGMFSNPPDLSHSPRQFRPEKAEMQYCIRFSDWWRDISTNAVSFGDETSAVTTNTSSRLHKLVSEVHTPGYFDCTVEVLHGYANANNQIYTLYVTDYTSNSFVAPVQAAWCPPQLASVVLQVELSDDCLALAPTMQPGEYYSIRNMRFKISGGGFYEGRVREATKIQKLNEDELESQPHLIELLKRKKQWESGANTTSVPEFAHQLFEEITANRHFNCTVEVVCISSKDDFSYLYVTDYTARSDLVPISAAIASDEFAARVVRISLNDAQVDVAQGLAAGDFIAIRNLRLRPSGVGSLLAGRLGGDQRLITKLNPKASGNAELRALLRRKEEFEAAQLSHPKRNRKGKGRAGRQKTDASGAIDFEAKASSSKLHEGKGKVTAENEKEQRTLIRDVKASAECPAVFRVRARVVDFFPDDLDECTVLRCTNCNQTIPKTRCRCTQCDDAMEDETFVQAFFQLYFRIEDEEGTALDVSVSDERCSVLEDLMPGDVHEDGEAFNMLAARLKPLLGDLLYTRGGEACRRPVAEDVRDAGTPLLDLTIGSWSPKDEPNCADSRAYMVLKHAIYESE